MILTITFLVVAYLQPANPTVVTDLKPNTIQVVNLKEVQPTIVKTWEVN